MAIIDTQKISRSSVNSYPYIWGYIQEAISQNYITQMIADFPSAGYLLRQSSRNDKNYKMLHKQIYDSRLSSEVAHDLSHCWQTFILQLLSKEYIQNLSEILTVNLLDCDIEMNCWRYASGDWLSPHTDKVEKVASQLFYFNETWNPKWGGSFRVLNSNSIEDCYTEYFPSAGNSILLKRSSNSWHGVYLQESPNFIFRQVFQCAFWKK